jgi:LacI family transcriptional regulator
MKAKKKNITRRDVADLAAVSHMTVTRVLNNHPMVSPAVRERVLNACKELNYRRNLNASALRNNKSFAIGVIVPTLKHSFYGRLISEIEIAARKHNYHIITIQSNQGNNIPTMQWSDLEFLLARQIDGLIIDMSLPIEVEKRLKEESIPVIFIDSPPAGEDFDFVGCDDQNAIYKATKHLIDLGHRKIAFAGGFEYSRTMLHRRSGWELALNEAKITLDYELNVQTGFLYQHGVDAVKILLRRNREFTAIVCANDYVAMGAIHELQQHKLSVPEDIAVTGMADEEIGAFFSPALTTVTQSIDKIAKFGVERLIARLSNSSLPTVKQEFKGELIIRNSSFPRK